MTTVKGQQVNPTRASDAEAKTLQRIYDLKAAMKANYDKLDGLYAELEPGRPYVFKATVVGEDGLEETAQWRTVVIGRPEGHFIYYRTFDMVINQTTTKADLAELSSKAITPPQAE